MVLDLLIKNGDVVFPGNGVRKANIGIRDGKIAGIYSPEQLPEAAKVLDAEGLHILPGVIDAHQHLGIYNSVEDDFRGTKEHAVGGITTLVNYDRAPESYHSLFPKWKEAGESNSYIDFAYSLGILTEQHIEELEEYVDRLGVTSFKFFRNYERQLNDKFKIGNGIHLSSYDLMRLLTKFREISPKLLLAIHCENMDINRALTSKLKKEDVEDSLRTWSKTSPGYAEAESLLSTVYLNHIAGGNVFLVHLSSGASVDVLENIQWLTSKGVKVETCPHYLTLTEEEPTLHAKVGPPVHTQWDQDRLWEGIAGGWINAIGTDHVPNSKHVKYKSGPGVWDAQYGFAGAGALLPLMLTEGYLKRGIPLERIADITSRQVADSFNLPGKGRIEVHADADLAIVDLQEWKTITPELLHSDSDYSVYEGKRAAGWPVYTLSRGEIIVDHGVPVASNGRGKYIHRTL
ncbi:dihydroorotase family protein [Paenibacillus chartarius]|uniref:Dihydroorotase family protein n=1 Tax=Paenibacillus chartarius TaxID=747481 RepID=A0ABV6DI02_9BACL